MDYKDYQAGQTSANFWFKGKNNLINILMSKISKKGERLKILNIGAGTGEDLKILNKYGDNYLIDINKNALNLIDEYLCIEKRAADACKLPYQDDFFDIVVSFDVFEHISNDNKAILEAHRVLKKGGRLVFIVPAFNFLFSNHDKALGHKRRYNKKMLKESLKEFKNLKLYYWNSIMFLLIAPVRLIKRNSKPKIDRLKLPEFINSFLYFLLNIEGRCIKYEIPLPFGLSIAGFCQK
ncbi:MAG: type 11 methyltransferase [Parcubacteria group bacterium Licking1014_1]|nr:MAG: type 11 methyltransferase [Parcubacteria group bacterium Licking1014_1]